MSGRISGLKNKINKLEGENFKLVFINRGWKDYIAKYKAELKNKETLEYLIAKEKEIIELKQECQCKQVEKDSLQYKLDRAEKNLRDAHISIFRLNTNIKNLEDKKIKNRLRKLLVG